MTIIDSLVDMPAGAILVKGRPGTGKTTLVLELLRRSGGGTYVSTRVSKQRIATHFPGIHEVFAFGRGASQRYKTTTMQDLRLATAEQVLQVVMKELGNPGSMVALDSWDAIAKEIDPVERLRTEKTLLAITEPRKNRLIFVSEEPELTTTDYLVDAVVSLEMELYNDRILRMAHLKKIRGSKIERPVSVYTLGGGTFQILEPPVVMMPGDYSPKTFRALKDAPGHYSTGSPGIDSTMGGGMGRGTLGVTENGPHLSPLTDIPIQTSIRCNFMMNGGCAVIVPRSGVPAALVIDSFRKLLPKGLADESLRVGGYEQYEDPCVFMLDPSSISKSFDLIWKAMENLKKGKRNCFLFIGIDQLESVHGPDEVLRFVSQTMHTVRPAGDIVTIGAGTSSRSKGALIDMADIHVMYEDIHGTLVRTEFKPTKTFAGISYDYSRGYPQIVVTPLV